MIIHSKSKDTASKQGPGSQKRESQFKNQWKICFTNFQRHFAQIKDDSEEKLNEEQRQVKCFQKDILKRSENLKLFTKVQNWIKKEKINSKKTFFKAIQNLDKEMIQFIYASLYVFLEQLYYRNVISKIYEHKSIQQNEELLRKFLISNNGEQFPYPHETQQQSSFNLNLSNNSIQQQNQQQMDQIQQQQQQANINDKQSSFLQDQITIKQEFNQDIEEEQKIDFDICDNENNTNTTSNNNNKIQNSMSRSRQNNSTRNNKKGKKIQQKQLKQYIDRLIDGSKKVGSNYAIEQENGDYFFKYKIDTNKNGRTYEIKIALTKETIMQLDQESIQNSFLSDSQQSSQQQSNINQPQSSFLNNTNNNDQNEYQQQSKSSQFLNSFNSKKNIQYKVKVLNKEQNAIEKIYNQEDIDKYSLILPQKEDKSFFFSENQQLSLKQQSGMQFESFHLSCCSDYKEGENLNKMNDANTSNNSFQQKRRSSRKLNQSCINNLGQNDKINNNKQNSTINEKISLISSRPDSEISQENQIILTNKVPESTEEIQTQKLEKLHLKQQLGHIQQQQQQQLQESEQQKSRKPSLEIYNNNNNISNNNFPYYNDQNQIQNNQLLQDQQQQQYQEASYFLEQSNNNINNISNNGIISDNNPCQSCQTQQNILCNCNGQFNQQEMLNKDNISSIAPCDSRKWSEEFNF